MYIYQYIYILIYYIYICIIYIHRTHRNIYTYIHTHLKKNVSVYLLRKYLGGPDMKKRIVGNSLDGLILFF